MPDQKLPEQQQQQQQDLFVYPYSLAFGIIVGYALALLIAVIVAAVRRKSCCPIVAVGGPANPAGLTRRDRTGRSVHHQQDELVPLTAPAQDSGCTVELVDDAAPMPTSASITDSNSQSGQPAGSGREVVEIDEADDESGRLRRLTDQLDAILDEFCVDEATAAAVEAVDNKDLEVLAPLAQEIVSRAVQQAIEACRLGVKDIVE